MWDITRDNFSQDDNRILEIVSSSRITSYIFFIRIKYRSSIFFVRLFYKSLFFLFFHII